MRITFIVMAALAMSCGEPQDQDGDQLDNQPTSLVSVNAWTQVDKPDDPLQSHRPENLECTGDGVLVENGVLEIDTGRCPYFAGQQSILRAMDAGDWVAVTIYHDGLYADPPGSAHLALLFDGELLWETTIPIPAQARLFTETFQLPRSYPLGARVDFHLHNHGLNHWRLVRLEYAAPP